MTTDFKAKQATLKQWKLFTLAVEKGSLLGAASAGESDTALISREIKKLEHLLQEPLLVRSRTGVKPTWLGEQKYAEAVALLKEFDDIFCSKKQIINSETSVIRIAVPSSISDLIVKPLAEFEKLTGSDKFRMEINSYESISDISLDNFHLIFCVHELPNVRLIAYDIANIAYGIFASPSFLEGVEPITEPEQLEILSLIHRKSERVLLHGPKQSLTISVEPKIRVNTNQAMISSVTEGMGVALSLPLWAALPYVKNKKLVRVLPDWQLPSSPVWLLRHPGREITPLEKLVPFLRDSWNDHPVLAKRRKRNPEPITDSH